MPRRSLRAARGRRSSIAAHERGPRAVLAHRPGHRPDRPTSYASVVNVAYFPLRSSVELFNDPNSPEPVTRAKLAAILYDLVVFETGLYEQTIGETASFGVTVEPTPERRERARVVPEAGESFTIGVGVQKAKGVAARPEDMRLVADTNLVVHYSAEWHTDVIDKLEELEPDWASGISSDDVIAKAQLAPAIGDVKRSLEQTTPQDQNASRRRFTIDALSRDAVVAAAMDYATLHATSLFKPLLDGLSGTTPDHPGNTALWFAICGIERLTWEDICAFREHAGSEEARARLREAEERVAAEGLDAAAPQFAERVGREVTSDLLAALDETKPDLGRELAKDAANIGIATIPLVGAALSGAASVGETVAKSAAAERTWHAALIQLDRSARSSD
jgi:hypothetical protein